MVMTVKITGIQGSIARVREVANVPDEVLEATAEAGSSMQSEARDNAPVDTGTLVKSIQFRMQGPMARVEVKAGYGGFVEFGTTRMRAQPFFTPAFAKASKGYEKALRKILAGA